MAGQRRSWKEAGAERFVVAATTAPQAAGDTYGPEDMKAGERRTEHMHNLAAAWLRMWRDMMDKGEVSAAHSYAEAARLAFADEDERRDRRLARLVREQGEDASEQARR